MKPLIAARHAYLAGVEGDVLLELDRLVGRRVVVEQALDDAVADHAGLDDLLDVARLEARVEDAARVHDDDRALLAEAVTARLDDRDLVGQAAPLELVGQGRGELGAPRGVAGGAGADADLERVLAAGRVGGPQRAPQARARCARPG